VSALRKIMYTILASGVLFVAISNAVLELSYAAFFLVCAVFGIFIAHIYRELEPADSWERASLIYLPIASITIVAGTISNLFFVSLNQSLVQLRNIATPTDVMKGIINTNEQFFFALASLIAYRVVTLELVLLTLGLLGPLLIVHYYKKQKIPWADVLWDVFIIIALYAIMFFIQQIIIGQLINVAVVKV